MFRILIGGVVLASLAGAASANPRALPFTYTTDTLPEGQVEIEEFTDLTPLYYLSNGNPQRFLASQHQMEIEIGLLDRLELGLYFTYVPEDFAAPETATPIMPEGTGLKQRLRYIFADPGDWPIDVGVYGEITENTREIEFEGKLLLQRRFDRLRIAANVVSEYELYFSNQHDLVLNPSAGATYELTPKVHLGVDSWLRGEYPQNPKPAARTFALGPELYVGPALMLSFGKLWWSVGAYVRVTDTSVDMKADLEAGLYNEVYGPVWFRSMIGYNL
jgi:hypothetical protein